jgi:hypothetical protein
MNSFLLFIILAATVSRVTRFIVFDSLIDVQREWVLRKLKPPAELPVITGDEPIGTEFEWTPPQTRFKVLRDKLATLIDCPWCVSIWVSAATLWATYLFTEVTVPLPVFYWLALSMVATLLIDWSDGSRNISVTMEK